MDAVQKVGNGHPGTAMSLAPAAYLLFQKVMRHDPTDPHWLGPRPVRAVLRPLQPHPVHPALPVRLRPGARRPQGAAHLGLADPGPPGVRAHRRRRDHHRPARARAWPTPSAWRWPPAASAACSTRTPPPGDEPVRPPRSACIASDGDIEEGVTAEASSLAGTPAARQPRRRSTTTTRSRSRTTPTIAFTEDIAARYEAYGWHVQTSTGPRPTRRATRGRRRAARGAARPRKAETDRPSFIVAAHDHRLARARRSMNTGKSHGSALGRRRGRRHQEGPGLRPGRRPSRSPTRCSPTPAGRRPRRAAAHADVGRATSPPGRAANPERAALLDRLLEPARCPTAGTTTLPVFEPAPRASPPARPPARCSTRSRPCCPSCGAARPTSPESTTPRSRASRRSSRRAPTQEWTGDPYGRTLHFGIREHAMGAILNGIALHGRTRAYGGTFLVFTDYMRPRRAAGRADGRCPSPTSGRTTRSASARTARPTSRSSTSPRCAPSRAWTSCARPTPTRPPCAWRTILERTRPARPASRLTRQNLPGRRPSPDGELAPADGVAKGGYVLGRGRRRHARGDPHRHRLRGAARRRGAASGSQAEGIPTRVVSMPCRGVVRRAGRRRTATSVLPAAVRRGSRSRPASRMGWHEYVGDAGRVVSHRALRRLGRLQDAVPRVRHHPRGRRRRRRDEHRAR